MITIGWLLIGTGFAQAETLDAGGLLEIDQRYRFTALPAGPWYAPAGVASGFERVKAAGSGFLSVQSGAWRTNMAGRLEALAGSRARGLEDAANPESVMPIRIRFDELSLDLWDVGVQGLDLRVGHQTVQWGVGDQFNPTNTLNPNDLEDPLHFGKQLPNSMIRVDYALGRMWTLSAVGVPVFRPSALPATAPIGTAFVDRMPVLEDDLRRELQAAQAYSRDATNTPTVVESTRLLGPGRGLENAQGMVRLGGSLGMQDVALSWYSGRSDIPQPVSNHTRRHSQEICHPERGSDCIDGYLLTSASMAYPRMHVAGFNGAGEINPFGFIGGHPIGWRVEVAHVQPEQTAIAITNDALDLGGDLIQPAGEYDYGLEGERPTVVSGASFTKWTLGVDYTFGPLLYVNMQWVHGMVDEFGSGDFISPGYVTRAGDANWEIRRYRLGDYLVVGADLQLGGPTLRLFSLVDLTGYIREDSSGRAIERERFGPFSPEGYSAVVYPELIVPMKDGLRLNTGAVVMLGEDYTKFGDPAAGGTVGYVKLNHRF